jgi:hypothetical protein
MVSAFYDVDVLNKLFEMNPMTSFQMYPMTWVLMYPMTPNEEKTKKFSIKPL